MKKIYLLLIVLICFSANAQIVNIPDPVFKSDLINYNGVDTNNDGQIQVSEAQAITFIQIISSSIASFEGVQSFTNVNNFSILLGNSYATTLDLSTLTQLTNLDIPSCTALTNVSLNAPLLTVLKIPNSALSSINLTSCNSLQTVDLSNNHLASIQMPNNATNIYELNLSNNLLTNFTCPSVLSCALNLSNNQLTTFNTPLNYCETVDLSNNLLTSINFLAIQNITYFYLSNNPFTTLDLTGFVFGQIFNCSGPNLNNVKIPAYQNSSVASLYNEVFISGPNLDLVDFKNGSCDVTYGISGIGWPNPIRWYITGSPNLVFCVDNDLSCGGGRTEEFFFSHLNIIYTDSVIPIGTPPTNLITTNCSLNTIPFEVVEDFNLYPNPAANTLNIDVKETIVVKSIALYNTLGQLVVTIPNAITTDTISLDISNLKAGVYFVSVATDKGKTTQRFVKK